ncbi:MAG: hypothetical protein RSF90_06535, partial [Pygmaiobacter sp.]
MSKRIAGIFLYGAVGYASLEILARGRTHWSMAIAGGCGLVLLFCISRHLGSRSVFFGAVLGALCITAMELAIGLLLNRVLCYNVWSYADQPLNLWGQICPQYTAI